MVQRYIEIPEAEVATCMHEHFEGDYVRYADYKTIEQLLSYVAACINEYDLPDDVRANLEEMGLL